MSPVRLQLSRRKGFNLQALSLATNGLLAVNVARPSKWGNPYKVGEYYNAIDDNGIVLPLKKYRCTSAKEAVECFHEMMANERWNYEEDIRADLAGKNVACWCSINEPCHGDVLLELANPPVSRERG